MTSLEIENTTAFATGLFQGVQVVAEYMKNRSSLIEDVFCKPDTGYRDACMKGLWFRARAWMQSLEVLNHAKHVQAISVANRALLEITVDMVLLHHDKTNSSGWKMFQWGMSERMRAAEQTVKFYEEQGTAVPEKYKALENFFLNEKTIVDDYRIKLWPNTRNPQKAVHPARWTGSSDLSVDIKEADRLYGRQTKADLGLTLQEYYRTEYRKMNWQIHSGIAGIWNFEAPAFELIAGMSLKWAADFGMLCTKVALMDFGYHHAVEGLSKEWEAVKSRREFVFAETQNRLTKLEDPLKQASDYVLDENADLYKRLA
jgi:Family of unknown function (DUF5677)